ncbi:MAG: hypothetical protein LBV32_02425 [Tannerellaceae bacterium]|jgi:hypothetical protein|nr:hypothetical protein [Tannerellaceae bacterium]
MKTEQSPLEKLHAEQQQLRIDAHAQEEKIGADIKYIQSNGTRLLIRSVTSAILQGLPVTQSNRSDASARYSTGITGLVAGGLSAVMKERKGILPVAWKLVQPFVLTWGIKAVKRLLSRKGR